MFLCWLQLEKNMQGGMHVITHYYCIFNCRNQDIARDNTATGSLWQRREIRKFGKSIWRKYGEWFILTKERKQTSLENQFGENTASG